MSKGSIILLMAGVYIACISYTFGYTNGKWDAISAIRDEARYEAAYNACLEADKPFDYCVVVKDILKEQEND